MSSTQNHPPMMLPHTRSSFDSSMYQVTKHFRLSLPWQRRCARLIPGFPMQPPLRTLRRREALPPKRPLLLKVCLLPQVLDRLPCTAYASPSSGVKPAQATTAGKRKGAGEFVSLLEHHEHLAQQLAALQDKFSAHVDLL